MRATYPNRTLENLGATIAVLVTLGVYFVPGVRVLFHAAIDGTLIFDFQAIDEVGDGVDVGQANETEMLEVLYRAIVERESSGRPQLVNPDSNTLGLGQLLPSNVPIWTKQCLGRELTPDEFLADARSQEQTVRCKLQEFLDRELQATNGDERLTILRVGATWYSGDPNNYNDTSPQYTKGTRYPSISLYSSKLWETYQQYRGEAASPASSDRVVSIALDWVGKQFAQGEVEQCAIFVRQVFKEAGIDLPIAQRPYDWKAAGRYTPEYHIAGTLISDEVGTLIRSKRNLQPGDIVAFTGTYGNFPAGTITHVGLYSGQGKVVDRSSHNAPVREISIDRFEFVVGVRPHAFTSSISSSSLATNRQKRPGALLYDPVPSANPATDNCGYDADSGLDICGPIGTPTYTVEAGTIVYAEPGRNKQADQDSNPDKPGFQTSYSVLIELDTPIDYAGVTVRYAWYTHLTEIASLQPGQQVQPGDYIGTIGVANKVPHLHLTLAGDRAHNSHLKHQQVARILGY